MWTAFLCIPTKEHENEIKIFSRIFYLFCHDQNYSSILLKSVYYKVQEHFVTDWLQNKGVGKCLLRFFSYKLASFILLSHLVWRLLGHALHMSGWILYLSTRSCRTTSHIRHVSHALHALLPTFAKPEIKRRNGQN